MQRHTARRRVLEPGGHERRRKGGVANRADRLSRRSVLTGGTSAAAALAAGPWLPSAGARASALPSGRERTQAVRVADSFYRALQAKDLDSFAALWTRDAIWRAPITPEGGPGQTEGRDAIVSMLREAFELFGAVNFEWRLEAMRDPQNALASWKLDNELMAGGRYRNRGLAVFRLKRGRISEVRGAL